MAKPGAKKTQRRIPETKEARCVHGVDEIQPDAHHTGEGGLLQTAGRQAKIQRSSIVEAGPLTRPNPNEGQQAGHRALSTESSNDRRET